LFPVCLQVKHLQLPAASPQPAIQPPQLQLAIQLQQLIPLPLQQRIVIPPVQALIAPRQRLLPQLLVPQQPVIPTLFLLRRAAVPAPPAEKLVAVVFAVPALLTAALKLSLES
jgi:hypothetical protein